jgi:hypothetical protein
MSWRSAFVRQARSEQEVRKLLNSAAIEYSHRLHYLQMVSEKIAKAFQVGPDDPKPPEFVHRGFVRLLQTLKSRSDIQRALGFNNKRAYEQYIASLLDLADRVERLAPSLAGVNQPNPEYPWMDVATQTVIAPVDYSFSLFDRGNTRMIKLEALLDKLLYVIA